MYVYNLISEKQALMKPSEIKVQEAVAMAAKAAKELAFKDGVSCRFNPIYYYNVYKLYYA